MTTIVILSIVVLITTALFAGAFVLAGYIARLYINLKRRYSVMEEQYASYQAIDNRLNEVQSIVNDQIDIIANLKTKLNQTQSECDTLREENLQSLQDYAELTQDYNKVRKQCDEIYEIANRQANQRFYLRTALRRAIARIKQYKAYSANAYQALLDTKAEHDEIYAMQQQAIEMLEGQRNEYKTMYRDTRDALKLARDKRKGMFSFLRK